MPQRFWNSFAGLRFSPRLARGLAVGVLLCSASISFAQQLNNMEDDPDEQEKAWQEVALQLPAAPEAANLVDFYVSPLSTSTSYIDLKSLTIGSDNVVRYTIITKTSGGATNISYEGLRCETFEVKVYAFGRPDGSWSRSRQIAWKRIVDFGSNRQTAALYKQYFCQNGMLEGNLSKITTRLRSKRPIDLGNDR